MYLYKLWIFGGSLSHIYQFWKYYPSLIAQGIVYANTNSNGTGPHQKLTGAYVFQLEADGIASVARNSTGVFTVTLKRSAYSSYPNVVV